MNKVMERIGREFLRILPAFIFFLVMFHILVITRALALKQYGITAASSTIAVIGALIVAKVILIADRIPLLNQYPKRPLIWNIILKTITFNAVAFIFLIIEELIRQARHYGGFSNAIASFREHVIWPIFGIRLMWLAILLLFYCAAVEFFRVIGPRKALEILFTKAKK